MFSRYINGVHQVYVEELDPLGQGSNLAAVTMLASFCRARSRGRNASPQSGATLRLAAGSTVRICCRRLRISSTLSTRLLAASTTPTTSWRRENSAQIRHALTQKPLPSPSSPALRVVRGHCNLWPAPPGRGGKKTRVVGSGEENFSALTSLRKYARSRAPVGRLTNVALTNLGFLEALEERQVVGSVSVFDGDFVKPSRVQFIGDARVGLLLRLLVVLFVLRIRDKFSTFVLDGAQPLSQ